jgi:DNA-binding beta-propeller fold protein YncE
MGAGGRAAAFLGITALTLCAAAAPATAEFGFVTSWPLVGPGEDHEVRGVAVDPAGNVYAADYDAAEIQKFTADGTFITKWGSHGSANGQFAAAKDVAVGASGTVYVADHENFSDGNNRIQKFTSNGAFLTKWGSRGSANGQFRGPSGIATDSAGNVYVADTGNDRIQKFDPDGGFITKWPVGGPGDEYRVPNDVATDSSGDVYVADSRGFGHILKYSSDGTFIAEWEPHGNASGEFHPFEILTLAATSAGDVWVAAWADEYIFTGPGVPVPPFARLQQFTSSGEFVREFGCYGSGDENFARPWGVATDSTGNVYVGDGVQVQKLGDPGAQADCNFVFDATAKHRQKLKKMRVSAACPDEPCELTVHGRADVGKKGARLRPKAPSLAAGEKERIRLRVMDSRHRRKIRRAMERKHSKPARVAVQLEAEDDDGSVAEKVLTFRLRR